MKANQATYPVRVMSRLLGVSASGFYAWVRRPQSARTVEDIGLTALIHTIHRRSGGAYGAPSIQAELADDHQRRVGTKRVARLMRAAGLRGLHPRRFVTTTVGDPAADRAVDQVDRQFAADGPDRLWVADITYVPTWAGFLYLAIVLDVWSRRIVGWAMEPHLKTELVLSALNMALAQRRPEAVIHHSDRGCQGEFNWSSQHLDDEVLQCRDGNGEGQTGRVGLRCVRLVGRRQRGVRSSNGSGRRSRGGCRVRMPLCPVACRRPWVVVGSVRAVGCRRSAWRLDQLATCPLRSGKRSRSCELRAPGCVTLPVGSGEPRRLSRESYVATRRLGAAVWRIGRRLRSGTAPDVPRARRSPSWPRTIG